MNGNCQNYTMTTQQPQVITVNALAHDPGMPFWHTTLSNTPPPALTPVVDSSIHAIRSNTQQHRGSLWSRHPPWCQIHRPHTLRRSPDDSRGIATREHRHPGFHTPTTPSRSDHPLCHQHENEPPATCVSRVRCHHGKGMRWPRCRPRCRLRCLRCDTREFALRVELFFLD